MQDILKVLNGLLILTYGISAVLYILNKEWELAAINTGLMVLFAERDV